MTMHCFNLQHVDSSWHNCLQSSLTQLNSVYLNSLLPPNDWLPGAEKIFNAFTLPLQNVNYILFGESPYPRRDSANGYAFWDASIDKLWSETGMSKAVNRATSFRNILKMLLLAEGKLSPRDLSQNAIAALDKTTLIQSNELFFQRLLSHGFLLLNATPVLQSSQPVKDAKAWQPFMQSLLSHILNERKKVKLILFGRIANTIDSLISDHTVDKLYAEHPYNLSFITNQDVLDFFKPLHLLKC